MEKIQLSDENKSILHILTKKEWEEIPNDYKTDYIVDYTKKRNNRQNNQKRILAWIWYNIIF